MLVVVEVEIAVVVAGVVTVTATVVDCRGARGRKYRSFILT